MAKLLTKKYLKKFNTQYKKTIPKFDKSSWDDNGCWSQCVRVNKKLIGKVYDNKKKPNTHYYGADHSNPYIVENIKSFIFCSYFK